MDKQNDFPNLQNYDVVIIGGGVNGTASLRELAQAGYRVLLVEAQDFAAGASGRSSRMLHCGLRYFETPNPIWDAISKPRRFSRAIGMARDAMIARAELAADDGVDTRPIELSFPVWRDGPFPRWQLDLGLRLLSLVGPSEPPLDRRIRNAQQTKIHPIGRHLRSQDSLHGMVSVREYLFSNPDRLCIDNALSAKAFGAEILLQTQARIVNREQDGLWRIELRKAKGEQCEVFGRCVLNMAGTWSDAAGDFGKKLICGTKGSHIIIRLPEGFDNKGIATLHRGGFPFYGLPLGKDRFYFGPTETLYEGDARHVGVTSEDIDFLLAEANHLLPGLRLKRQHIEQCWAGVRPLTNDPNRPMGARERTVHDLKAQGFENVLAMTAGPIMSHRSAGKMMLGEVSARIGAGSHSVREKVPNCIEEIEDREIRAVQQEYAKSIYGVMVHRTAEVWDGLVSPQRARQVAEKLAPHLGWDAEQIEREIQEFLNQQKAEFSLPEN